ncbi:MAG: D-alanyl-D-alanine carboxypeptidase family protein, partial [Candidatus Dormibacteraceae bacterium]
MPALRGEGICRSRRSLPTVLIFIAAVTVVIEALLVILLLRPLPPLQLHLVQPSSQVTAVGEGLAWPSGEASALGVVGQEVMTSGPTQPLPMASTAKLMTALMVLKRHPLALGQPGPRLVIGAREVSEYQQDKAGGQSVTAIAVGEQLSEYQALQALLLPSANNVATLLARWSFGSLGDAVVYLNAQAKLMGLTSTHFVDASGFDPGTVSTPIDLVRLGEAAQQIPVLAEIVDQTRATLPIAGRVTNVNHLLGVAGIVGIKTGNTESAGGCYVFAAPYRESSGLSNLLIGAVMGASDLAAAMDSSLQLLEKARSTLSP